MQSPAQNQTCQNCQAKFTLTEEDLNYFNNEIKIPVPTWCPNCRQQRRLTWRNEDNLYKRKCDSSGKEIVSVFSAEKPFPVYENEYWYSDKWDALSYGREFDFSRPFFEQFRELLDSVPQLALSSVSNQNSDYVNQCGWSKNCYLTFEADYNENCMYSYNTYESKTSMDNFRVTKCELCYECINCDNCYNLKFSENCQNCSDSWFLKDCIGCKNCFGCINLRNKEYYFLNQKFSREEYLQKVAGVKLKTNEDISAARERFRDFASKYPHRYMNGAQNEDSTGDYLWRTQRCYDCYDLTGGQDCKYVFDARNCKKVYDLMVFGSAKGVEFSYDNHEVGEGCRGIFFCDQIWEGCYDLYYCKLCINNSHDLFGCVGLKHKEYCILNKQYSKEQYLELKGRIIQHMISTGEWGHYFPASGSPFAYNETAAMKYFPLTKAEILARGFKWKEEDKNEFHHASFNISGGIEDITDSILKETLGCKECGRNYKIIESELKFYRRAGLPVPVKCWKCRQACRFKVRNARKSYDRKCEKCAMDLKSTFAAEDLRKIYCEKCFSEVWE